MLHCPAISPGLNPLPCAFALQNLAGAFWPPPGWSVALPWRAYKAHFPSPALAAVCGEEPQSSRHLSIRSVSTAPATAAPSRYPAAGAPVAETARSAFPDCHDLFRVAPSRKGRLDCQGPTGERWQTPFLPLQSGEDRPALALCSHGQKPALEKATPQWMFPSMLLRGHPRLQAQ